jgi:hypothetical protein
MDSRVEEVDLACVDSRAMVVVVNDFFAAGDHTDSHSRELQRLNAAIGALRYLQQLWGFYSLHTLFFMYAQKYGNSRHIATIASFSSKLYPNRGFTP